MKPVLLLTAFFTACPIADARQADQEPTASATLTGSLGLVQQTTEGGKTTTVVVLHLNKSTTVRAEVSQTLEAVQKLGRADLEKLLARDQERLREAQKAGDPEKVKRIEQEYRDRLRTYISSPPVVVEGRLTLSGQQLSLRGMVRPLDAAGKAKAPPLGSAVVEGEALPGEYVFGKGQKSPLAVRNGLTPILVSGKLASENARAKGRVRVTGRLRLGDNGSLVVEADQVEVLGKRE
jgi:hypothetical protein